MPLTTALPAQDIEWFRKVYGPGAYQNPSSLQGTAGASRLLGGQGQLRPGPGRPMVMDSSSFGANLNQHTGYGGIGGGSSDVWDGWGGRGGIRSGSTGLNNVQGGGICPPDWMPQLTAAGGQAVGSMQAPENLVLVLDFHVVQFLLATAPAPWMDDSAGVFFIPYAADPPCSVRAIPSPALGLNPCIGGFGVFLNSPGGLARYEYVSWRTFGTTGTILERITVPLSVTPALDIWNTIRFVIIGATATEAATLQVQVNEQDIVPVRQFGSAQLDTPEASQAGASGMWAGFTTADGGGNPMRTQFSAKLGRFTPGGRALQEL